MLVLESKEELANEDRLRRAIESIWNINTIKLACEDRIDLMVVDRKFIVKGFIELKNRTCRYRQYPNYILNEDKYLAGLAWAKKYDAFFILVVEFTDGIYYCDLKNATGLGRSMGGSSYQIAAGEQKRLINIPWNLFVPLERKL